MAYNTSRVPAPAPEREAVMRRGNAGIEQDSFGHAAMTP
jgi:hypothetical protein